MPVIDKIINRHTIQAFNGLRQLLNKTPARCTPVLARDWNDRCGKCLNAHGEWEIPFSTAIGEAGVEEENRQGRELRSFAEDYSLRLTNIYGHNSGSESTYWEDGKPVSRVDYILVLVCAAEEFANLL